MIGKKVEKTGYNRVEGRYFFARFERGTNRVPSISHSGNTVRFLGFRTFLSTDSPLISSSVPLLSLICSNFSSYLYSYYKYSYARRK